MEVFCFILARSSIINQSTREMKLIKINEKKIFKTFSEINMISDNNTHKNNNDDK